MENCLYGARESYSLGGVSIEALGYKIAKGGVAGGSHWPLRAAGCHALEEPDAGLATALQEAAE